MTGMVYSGGFSGACTLYAVVSWLISSSIFGSGMNGSYSVSSVAWTSWEGGVLWGMVFVAIISIPIHSCGIDVSNRMTFAVCEDKLI